MKNILFYSKLIKHGSKKGQLNTYTKKIRFAFRTLIYYPWINNLTNFILKHDYLSSTVYQYPVLLSKMHRPYLSSTFKMSEKLNAIKDSYEFIDTYFSEEKRKILYTDGQIVLGEICGNNSEVFYVNLALYPHYDKEGEFNLILTNSDNITLSTLTFSLQKEKNEFRIFIGGLQGAPKDIDHSIIKVATKNLYGLFPKKIIIESLYFLEKSLGMKVEKICVGNSQHVYTAKRYKKKRTILSSYDSFWISLNAEKTKLGLWILPEKLERKDILDVPSKKRGQYRKKYGLLKKLESSILGTFNKKKVEVTELI
ncbi:MAG: VirK/YbjX family protein [Psychrilyobacter sp.]|uniref:VirK/YbjX family protein n=1 Tax=Psychrilyobacter sp. TaxID=2586924 RepID=UPI003C772B5F